MKEIITLEATKKEEYLPISTLALRNMIFLRSPAAVVMRLESSRSTGSKKKRFH